MEPFLGEIRMFAGNFAPSGWALCQGQLLAVSQNDALFSLLGTIYGGDGRTTFGLPDLRGRIAVGFGSSAGTLNLREGQKSGSETNHLTANQIGNHSHTGGQGTFNPLASTDNGNAFSPEGRYMAGSNEDGSNEFIYTNSITTPVSLGPQTFPVTINPVGGAGAGLPNQQPTLPVNYIIAIVGTYPSRT